MSTLNSIQERAPIMTASTENTPIDLYDFFHNAPIGLHIVDADGKIARANRAELTMLGYDEDPSAYIGHHIAEFHADRNVIEGMLQTLLQGHPLTHHQARLLKKDGSI